MTKQIKNRLTRHWICLILLSFVFCICTGERYNNIQQSTNSSDVVEDNSITEELDYENILNVFLIEARKHLEVSIEEVCKKFEEEKQKELEEIEKNRPKLNRTNGVFYGPNGKETYYNLNMSGVVARMHRLGYEGNYWVREDGVKMFGDYVMVAANLRKFSRGSIVDTSLGKGIVCDTGGFVYNGSGVVFDIAVSW